MIFLMMLWNAVNFEARLVHFKTKISQKKKYFVKIFRRLVYRWVGGLMSRTKAELLLLKLIHLFAREVLFVKKLEIEETKTT